MSDPASKSIGHNSNLRIRNAKLSYFGIRNVAIYAFSSGKFLNVRVLYACVKDLTNIMSDLDRSFGGKKEYSKICRPGLGKSVDQVCE